MAGRPTDYEDRFCDLLIDHMKQGLSFESFGGTIGCVKQTLYNWTEKFPQFMDAKKEGELRSLFFWEIQGLKGLWVEKEGPTFNTTNFIFQMKNRFGWRDRSHDEVRQELAAKQELSDEQFARLVKIARGET